MSAAVLVPLDGMHGPEDLKRWDSGGQVVITRGSRTLFCFDGDDVGMRNLVIVALRDAGVSGGVVAAMFGVSDQRVSDLRRVEKRCGSAGLVAVRGRPSKLTVRQVAKAKAWKAEGVTGTEIAGRLGVSAATISRATAGTAVQAPLFDADADADTGDCAGGDGHEAEGAVEGDDAVIPIARGASTGTVSCRYAGAMLVHSFLSILGGAAVLRGGRRAARDRFTATEVSLCAMFGLVLGAGSVESIKHLGRTDVGLLAGCGRAPELKTLRARLAAVGEDSDALAMMRTFTAAMLAVDPAPDAVFYVDDHFVPYYGSRPMAKGWNTKRRHAMRGWDDTMICDAKGRILAFTSAEPSGLSVTIDTALSQLATQLHTSGVPMVGFDRGGSYPAVFTRLDAGGIEWVTWRRGDLNPPKATPKRSWCTLGGARHTFILADEIVALSKDYTGARQITLYDNGEPVVQIITSNHTATAARIVVRMRSRWGIENRFKALTAHHGIDQLCDYRMDFIDDTREIDNPERKTINAAIAALRGEHADIERQLGAARATHTRDPDLYRRLRDERYMIADEIEDLTTQRKTIPAKTAANNATPGLQRAIPKLERRAYQMVLRLLAHNALRWLAEHLDTYLNNPDEVHAVTRNLLHQPGTITYTPTAIIVTITAPDTPAITRALQALCDQLNHTTPATIPGDHRPITYQTTPTTTTTPPTTLPEV